MYWAIQELWKLFIWKFPSEKFLIALRRKHLVLKKGEYEKLVEAISIPFLRIITSCVISAVAIALALSHFLAIRSDCFTHFFWSLLFFALFIVEYCAGKKELKNICQMLEIRFL